MAYPRHLIVGGIEIQPPGSWKEHRNPGMRCVGATGYECAREAILGALTHPYLIIGVVLMFGFLLLYLASLSWEDLTYVMPFTAGDYVLVTILAFFILQEPVGPLRWAGSLLVALGIILVARS